MCFLKKYTHIQNKTTFPILLITEPQDRYILQRTGTGYDLGHIIPKPGNEMSARILSLPLMKEPLWEWRIAVMQ